MLIILLSAGPISASRVSAQSALPLLAPGSLTGQSGTRGPRPVPPSDVRTPSMPLTGSDAGAASPAPDSSAALSMFGLPRAGKSAAAARAPMRPSPVRLLDPAACALELRAAIDGAAERTPGLQSLAARQDFAAAKRRAASGFLPGAPTLGASYITDQAIRNRNARDAEISVTTQIWLPGEGSASVRAADADLARLQAQAMRQRLDLAGEVREQLATVATAEADARAARDRLGDARALETDIARRVRAADAAEAELLVASADRLDAQAALSEKSAMLDGARVDFRALTGREPVTAALNERELPAAARADDPRLVEVRRAVAVAQAGRDLAAIQVRDNPEIGLVGRQFRNIGGSVDDNALGVQLRIPLATAARNAPRRAAAEAHYADAAAAASKLERDLAARASRARIELASAMTTRDLAVQRADIFARQRALFERSFAGGEAPLADLIRTRTQVFQA